MGHTKEARPSVAAPRRAETGAGIDRPSIPKNDSITSGTGGQPYCVSDFLLIGEENALPLAHLKTMLPGMDGRAIRKQIELERRNGVPILSGQSRGCRGYWIAGDQAEIERFAHSMRHRAREILLTAQAIEGAADID